jgi:DNA-binding NarL/FixJ family response regulator
MTPRQSGLNAALHRPTTDQMASTTKGEATQGPVVEQLTKREVEVLVQLALDLKNEEIAAKLFLARATVTNYLVKIYQKLGVRTRAGAVAIGMARGCIPFETISSSFRGVDS